MNGLLAVHFKVKERKHIMDIESLMARAKNLQTQISQAQNSLASMRVKGISGNGAVIVDMSGKYDVISVIVRPDILNMGAETVSGLVADAYRDAKEKADELINNVMSDVSGELPDLN